MSGQALDPSAFMGNADELYQFLLDRLPDRGSMLDIGCGRGRFLQKAQERGWQVLGIDGDQNSVDQCKTAGLTATRIDIWDYFRTSHDIFDAITAIHLLEHFHPPSVIELLAQASRRLTIGGHLLLVTPNFLDWRVASHVFWLDETHVRPYPLPLLAAMGEESGFRVVHSSTQDFVKTGMRSNLARPFQRLRYGREYDRMNAVLLLQKI